MAYELISEEEYASLPDDDEECFVRFESICQRNMHRMIDENSGSDFYQSVREQYMSAVAAVAAECRIPNIVLKLDQKAEFHDIFSRFSVVVQGEVARIRIRGRGARHPYSVQLAPNTRTKIDYYIFRIRHAIDTSDLSGERKRAMGEKLDELVAELRNPRLGFAKTMAVLSAMLMGLAGATTIGAEGPAAVNNIMKLLAVDKDSEDAARLRLAAPTRALMAPTEKVASSPNIPRPSWDTTKLELDSEIPF